MIEEMEVETPAISIDPKSNEDNTEKETSSKVDENDNVVNAAKDPKEPEKIDLEKKESLSDSPKDPSDEEKTETEATDSEKQESKVDAAPESTDSDKQEPKSNAAPREMDILRAIKDLNDKHGSSVNAIKGHLELQFGKRSGEGGVSKKRVLKILNKCVQQKIVQLKDDKYRLTEKGRKLSNKVNAESLPIGKKEDAMEIINNDLSKKVSEATSKKSKDEEKKEFDEKNDAILKNIKNKEENNKTKSEVTTRDMITCALNSSDSKKGMSLNQIQSFVEKKYKMGTRYNEVIKKTLKKGVQKKVFINEGGNYKLHPKEKSKIALEKPSVGKTDQTSKEKKDIPKEGKKDSMTTLEASPLANNNKAEKDSAMGEIILNAIIDLERLTREGSKVGKIKSEMVSKYKMDENKFGQFLKDGIKRRGMKKVDKKSK